jgi:hypothetical protein
VQESAAANDVTVSKCSVTKDFGVALTHATVRITNSTDRTQSYLATISVNDSSGARVGEVNVVSNSLAAGQSVELDSPGSAAKDFKPGQLTCTVAKADRFPS